MIIVSYLTENFIKETLQEEASKLRIFLETLCVLKEHIFFIFEPNMSLASIKKQQPKNIKQTNISLWAKYLKDLKRLGRIKDHQYIKDYYIRKNIDEEIHKEQFIKQSFKNKVFYLSFKNFYIKKSDFYMESLGEDLEQIKFKIENIFKENLKPTKNIKQTNISLWAKYLKDLKRLGRIKDHQYIREYYIRKNIGEEIHKEQFIKQALKNKVFYLSFKNFYIKKSDFDMESLGEDLEQIKFKIEYMLKDNVKPTKNINNLEGRENLFFDKVGGFCCFYNTLIWIDRYILDNKKINPKIYLKTPTRLLNGSKINNLIILTSEP